MSATPRNFTLLGSNPAAAFGDPVTVAHGGTGAATAAGALTNLGAAASTLVLEFTYSTAPSGATGGTGSWSYQLPTGAKTLLVESLLGPASGGGAGGRFASGQVPSGGGSGGNGAGFTMVSPLQVADLGGTLLTLSIPDGGAGAPGQTADSSAGANGSAPSGPSTITVGGVIIASAAHSLTGGGGGGNNVAGTAGVGAVLSNTNNRCLRGVFIAGVSGVAGGTTGAGTAGGFVTTASNAVNTVPPRLAQSGAGGGIPAVPASQLGGAGGSVFCDTSATITLIAGGAAGNASAGGAAVAGYGSLVAGAGGGASNAAGAGFAGGAGTRGMGGGGGGASLNGSTSGAGGKGGSGFARLIVTF